MTCLRLLTINEEQRNVKRKKIRKDKGAEKRAKTVKRMEMATVWKPGNCVLVVCSIVGTAQVVSSQAHFGEMENLPI